MILREILEALEPETQVRAGWVLEQLREGESDLADLTVEEAGLELGRAPSTIRGWLGSGELRGYRMKGREWRIPRAALREFLEAQRGDTPAETNVEGDLGAWRDE